MLHALEGALRIFEKHRQLVEAHIDPNSFLPMNRL
jgi:hypothetical protein